MSKLISGCMITKNESEYLKQSIGSIIDFVDELIIIDDNSTDATLDIISSFPQDKITLVHGNYNGDKTTQRNEYIARATGKWIFCPDGDEVFTPEGLKWLDAYIRGQGSDMWSIRFHFHQFWRDFRHIINGHMWDQFMQRFYRNLPGVMHRDIHHSVSLPKVGPLTSEADRRGKTFIARDHIEVFHYSYCKPSNQIRRKIEYYMYRDNPNCTTDELVKIYIEMHPYFSNVFNQPRYGDLGLYCCGSYNNKIDNVKPFIRQHPDIMKTHPLWSRYYEYPMGMNRYMEEHWQFHNHINMPHHQKRFQHTAGFCEGTVVEVGAANGDSTEYLQQYNRNAFFKAGVEATDWGFEQARTKHPNITFYKGYAENLPLKDNSFDTVLLSEIIEHVHDPEPVLKEAFRVAKKKVIITSPAKPHPDPDHKRVITIQEMREMFGKYGTVRISGLTFGGFKNPEKIKIAEREEDIHFAIAEVIL